MAVAIGLNPSKALPDDLDKTNELVLFALSTLKKGRRYDGYYLINLYADIQATKFKRKGKTVLSKVIKDAVNAYTAANSLKKIDIYIFFGKSFYVSPQILSDLNGISNARFYTLGTKKCPHHHPGRGITYNTISARYRGASIKLSNHHYI